MRKEKQSKTQDLSRCEFIKSLEKKLPKSWSEDNDWLKKLYDEYQQRWRAVDDLVWKISSIMVPLSLAPYAVLANLEAPCWWQVVLLALGSFLMATLWCIAAGKMLYDNQKWLNRIRAIEERLCIIGFARPGKCEHTGP